MNFGPRPWLLGSLVAVGGLALLLGRPREVEQKTPPPDQQALITRATTLAELASANPSAITPAQEKEMANISAALRAQGIGGDLPARLDAVLTVVRAAPGRPRDEQSPFGTGPGPVLQIVACSQVSCNLRAAPSNVAPIITVLPMGNTLRLLEKRADGYSRVQINADGGSVGFIATAALRPVTAGVIQ